MAIQAFVLIALAIPIVSCWSIGGHQYYVKPNDTQTCVNDLVAWCDGMKFPTEKGSISIVSVSMFDSSGYCQAACIADSDGANCTKNGSPWFNCTKAICVECTHANQLFYKEKPLAKDSVEGADNETCETADKAFNELSVENLSADNSTWKRELAGGFGDLFGEVLRKFAGIFGGGFPFSNNGNYNPDVPSSSDVDTNIPPVVDDREKE